MTACRRYATAVLTRAALSRASEDLRRDLRFRNIVTVKQRPGRTSLVLPSVVHPLPIIIIIIIISRNHNHNSNVLSKSNRFFLGPYAIFTLSF